MEALRLPNAVRRTEMQDSLTAELQARLAKRGLAKETVDENPSPKVTEAAAVAMAPLATKSTATEKAPVAAKKGISTGVVIFASTALAAAAVAYYASSYFISKQ